MIARFFLTLLGILAPLWVLFLTNKLVTDPRYALWIKYDILNRKPFNCLKCFTFWTNAAILTLISVTFKSLTLSVPYAVMTLLITLMFVWDEKKQEKK